MWQENPDKENNSRPWPMGVLYGEPAVNTYLGTAWNECRGGGGRERSLLVSSLCCERQGTWEAVMGVMGQRWALWVTWWADRCRGGQNGLVCTLSRGSQDPRLTVAEI